MDCLVPTNNRNIWCVDCYSYASQYLQDDEYGGND